MAESTATWTKLTTSSTLERSSQTVAVLGDQVFIFGGELQPRQPRDSDVHTVNIKDDITPQATVTTLSSTPHSPPARVGAASTTLQGKIYMFSGRGGPAMTCLEDKGCLWVFDSTTSEWSTMFPLDPALPCPQARSYHALASDGNETIYLHAGCPANGRLSDLWSFHLPTRRWKELESAPGSPRGGSSIAFSGGQLYRMNGFDGATEQGGNVDIYDINTGTWSSFPFTPDGNAGPEPRSVSCLLAVDIHSNPSLVAMFGERDPSSLGHEGAGKMLGDVWVFDIKSKTWKQVRAHPGEQEPVARGWFDADIRRDSTKAAIVVHGGLNESNQRLGDVWLLKF